MTEKPGPIWKIGIKPNNSDAEICSEITRFNVDSAMYVTRLLGLPVSSLVFFFQPPRCLRNPLIPTSIINQSTTRVFALIYATLELPPPRCCKAASSVRCHASRQVAIVPVFRCARTPHCCLPKYRGSPRLQPLSRRPKGKRNARRAFSAHGDSSVVLTNAT